MNDSSYTVKACKYYVCRGTEEDLEDMIKGFHSRISPVLVEYKGRGKWAVLSAAGMSWNKAEKCFDFEPTSSARDASYLDKHRYNSKEEAVAGAKEAYESTENKYYAFIKEMAESEAKRFEYSKKDVSELGIQL